MSIATVNPKVSVIMVTYNQESTIARAIDSVLAQECSFPYEIIIGDDMSTDATSAICRDYALRYPERIRLIVNSVNKGLVDNYYDCILEARGKYLADCAGDDFWIDPLKLQKEADILDSDPEINIVHTAWEYYDEDSGHIAPSLTERTHRGLLKPVSDKGELFIPILTDRHGPLIHLCTALYRRDVLMRCYNADCNLFRNKEFLCEDLQLTTSLARDGKVAYLPDVTLRYSIGHPSVLSRGDMEKTYRFFLSTIKLLHYIMESNDIPRRILNDIYSHRLHYIFTQAFHLRDRTKRNEILRWYRTTGAKKRFKTHALTLLSSYDAVWKFAAGLQDFLKPHKK